MKDDHYSLMESVALVASEYSVEDVSSTRAPPIPAYLSETYWWAYLHPNAVRIFEREWLVNLILWGNMSRLTDAAIEELHPSPRDSVLQMACVYGDFSNLLAAHLARRSAALHLLDIATIQLQNARRKLATQNNIHYHHQDASELSFAPASFASTVLFFLLHEQPETVRRRTLSEAVRVTSPGGKIIIVDYHGPSFLNPWRYLMRPILHWLEPYALDLWHHPLNEFLPPSVAPAQVKTTLYFGGLYQKTVIQLPA
jgi:ubiquinone/menaquinone biosynthesis C-methylase UbiE